MQHMSCNGHILRAFVRILAQYPQVLPELEYLLSVGLLEHMGVNETHAMIEHWVRVTSDMDLGLKAGASMCIGASGALDFAMHSASTLREGFELAAQYSHLFGDALVLTLEENDGRMLLRFNQSVSSIRAVSDFTLSAWYHVHLRDRLGNGAGLSVLFAHPTPTNISEYERTFANAALVFDAQDYGFSFDAKLVDTPLDSGDEALHLAHLAHLALLHRRSSRSFAARVREHLAVELQRGRPTESRIAKQLRVSRRTLVRRMNADGTTFRLELEHVQRKLALYLIVQPDLSPKNIMARLGYAQVQAFYRAFRRWTGQTPTQYRQARLTEQRTPGTPNPYREPGYAELAEPHAARSSCTRFEQQSRGRSLRVGGP